jgi:hypothetical protein
MFQDIEHHDQAIWRRWLKGRVERANEYRAATMPGTGDECIRGFDAFHDWGELGQLGEKQTVSTAYI